MKPVQKRSLNGFQNELLAKAEIQLTQQLSSTITSDNAATKILTDGDALGESEGLALGLSEGLLEGEEPV